MDEKTRAELQVKSDQADTITDGALLRLSQNRYSWAIVAVILLLVFAAGAVIF